MGDRLACFISVYRKHDDPRVTRDRATSRDPAHGGYCVGVATPYFYHAPHFLHANEIVFIRISMLDRFISLFALEQRDVFIARSPGTGGKYSGSMGAFKKVNAGHDCNLTMGHVMALIQPAKLFAAEDILI